MANIQAFELHFDMMLNLSYPTERTATDGHDEHNITKVRMTTMVLIVVIIAMLL